MVSIGRSFQIRRRPVELRRSVSVGTWRREMHSDTSPPAAGEPVDDLGRLQRNAAALETNAEAGNAGLQSRELGQVRPVLLSRSAHRDRLSAYLDAWGYYATGTLFIVSGAVLFAIDSAAAAKRDIAIAAAESARKAFEEARRQA